MRNDESVWWSPGKSSALDVAYSRGDWLMGSQIDPRTQPKHSTWNISHVASATCLSFLCEQLLSSACDALEFDFVLLPPTTYRALDSTTVRPKVS